MRRCTLLYFRRNTALNYLYLQNIPSCLRRGKGDENGPLAPAILLLSFLIVFFLAAAVVVVVLRWREQRYVPAPLQDPSGGAEILHRADGQVVGGGEWGVVLGQEVQSSYKKSVL